MRNCDSNKIHYKGLKKKYKFYFKKEKYTLELDY